MDSRGKSLKPSSLTIIRSELDQVHWPISGDLAGFWRILKSHGVLLFGRVEWTILDAKDESKISKYDMVVL
ncbi:hypothetical protein TNCT_121821 [Trichonephila clavata]|uniref:Uncharacterized protein n=1 Tax=Trichonephila clavata TaxID=2740835 RepID=A0A8X6J471_TRICU|nr:hypothetical protein TNCT_121821 [Trichonephila clavata]